MLNFYGTLVQWSTVRHVLREGLSPIVGFSFSVFWLTALAPNWLYLNLG